MNQTIMTESEDVAGIEKALNDKAVIRMQEKTIRFVIGKVEQLACVCQKEINRKIIDSITWRVKSAQSIAMKLSRKGVDISYQNACMYLNDLIGIRIVCLFCDDIYKIVDYIRLQSDIEIIKYKDYISKPKKSGYQSVHLIVNVPILQEEKWIKSRVEIQIRSLAMNLWAKLDHQLCYKQDNLSPKEYRYVQKRLSEYAKEVEKMDENMVQLREVVAHANKRR